MSEACPECGKECASKQGLSLHRKRIHAVGPRHGTLKAYGDGCRCGRCREAKARQWRDYERRYHARPTDGSPKTLRACLLAFGVEPKKLREALKTRTVEDLHWGAFRVSGELRKFCRCKVPGEIAADIRRAS